MLSGPRVLLISILQKSHRNLSVLSLYSYLKANGVDIRVLFLPDSTAYNSGIVHEFLIEHRFDIIGLSVMTENYFFARTITRSIKEKSPQTLVIWGGVHPTLTPEASLEIADLICVGEGEIPFLQLIRRLYANKNISAIKGIGFKTQDRGTVVNEPFPLIMDLDALPHNAYDWRRFYVQDHHGLRPFGKKEYVQYSNYKGEDYTLMTSRSCPFSCAYCCNSFINKLYGARKTFRKRSVDHIIKEIRYAIDDIGNLKFINFIDDQFFINREWNDEFCIKYENEIGLPFIVRLKPGTFSEDDVRKLKRAGLKFVQIGLQSGSEKTNKEIFNRAFNREEIIQSSHIFSQNEIIPFYDVIIQNDLEDDEERKKTIDILFELEKPFKCNFFVLTPFPKTELEIIYKNRGVVPKTDPYNTGYVAYDENDPFFQLATIIPYTSRNICRYLYDNLCDNHVREVLKGYYRASRHLGDRQETTAQKLSPKSNPRSM